MASEGRGIPLKNRFLLNCANNVEKTIELRTSSSHFLLNNKTANTTTTHIAPSAVWVQYLKKKSAAVPRLVFSNKKAFSLPSQRESTQNSIPIISETRMAVLVR